MGTKHTPAPWRAVWKHRMFEIQNNDCTIVADIEVASEFNWNLHFDLPTAEANAKLIAAAPELQEACYIAKIVLEGMLNTESLSEFHDDIGTKYRIILDALIKSGM